MNNQFDRDALHDSIAEVIEEYAGENVNFILVLPDIQQVMTNCQPLDVAKACSSITTTYLQGNQEVHHSSLQSNLDG